MKKTVFIDTAPCSLASTDRRFWDAYSLQHQSDECSKLLLIFYEVSRSNVPEDSHFQIRRRENVKSHMLNRISLRVVWNIYVTVRLWSCTSHTVVKFFCPVHELGRKRFVMHSPPLRTYFISISFLLSFSLLCHDISWIASLSNHCVR
jgi:hypothetical protein